MTRSMDDPGDKEHGRPRLERPSLRSEFMDDSTREYAHATKTAQITIVYIGCFPYPFVGSERESERKTETERERERERERQREMLSPPMAPRPTTPRPTPPHGTTPFTNH